MHVGELLPTVLDRGQGQVDTGHITQRGQGGAEPTGAAAEVQDAKRPLIFQARRRAGRRRMSDLSLLKLKRATFGRG